MQLEVSNLRPTIIPKSDQLNADQLVGGDMTVTVTDVRVSSSEDQPVIIHYTGDNGRPYKPCKTMRKVLIFAWGEDGRQWVGRSMQLYHDASVRFGGSEVGGIRIRSMTDIEQPIRVNLTATKGKKALHTIEPLVVVTLDRVRAAIDAATNRASLEHAKSLAMQLAGDDLATAQHLYSERVKQLKKAATPAASRPTTFDLQAGLKRITDCTDLAVLQLIGDEVQDMAPGADQEAMLAALLKRDGELSAKN